MTQYTPPVITWIPGPPDESKIKRDEQVLVAFIYPSGESWKWAIIPVVYWGNGYFDDGHSYGPLDTTIVKYWTKIPDVQESEGT